jgi:hypothetical protein
MVRQSLALREGWSDMRASIVPVMVVSVLLLGAGAAFGQARVVSPPVSEEQVGTWVLTCKADPMTDRGECGLRHRLWLEMPDLQRAGAIGVALEVVLRDGAALPAVTARGLSLSDPQRGALAVGGAAEIRFDSEPSMLLSCALEGRDAVCVPEAADATRAAASLVEARRVLVRLKAPARAVTGGASDDVLALELSETGRAVALLRERAAGQPPRPPSTTSPSSFLDQLERMLRR